MAGDESARDGADGPARFDETKTARAGVQDVVGERDHDNVAADDAGHEQGVSSADGENDRLLAKITESFLHVGIDGERKAGFGEFGIFTALESLRGGVGGFGIFAWKLFVIAGRNVAGAKEIQAVGGDEVGGAIDTKNSGDADVIIDEADEGAGKEHAGLHADENRGIGAGELAGRNDFLDEGVHVGPVHGRTGASDQGHQIEMPELQVAAPGDVGDGENGESTGDVEKDAEVATVEAINENAAEERNDEARKRDDDDLPADGHGGMRGGHDVPAHADEVHAAAEERNEHRGEEVTESALGPEQGPIDTMRSGGGHGTF